MSRTLKTDLQDQSLTRGKILAACEAIVAERPAGIVLAVSGGPDSIALMHHFGPRLGGRVPLSVATVDHGLRPDSADDAAFAVAGARALGLDAHVLVWEGPKPRSALQERARNARYALLTAFARAQRASHLLTAHTLDDQAETILFRMTRGSGLAGLAGMAQRTLRDGIIHLRPLLDVPKSQLVESCRTEGWAYRTDPSNYDPRFARSRMRRLLPLLADEELDAARLAKLGARARRSDDALQRACETTWRAAALHSTPGSLRFDARRLASEPAELVIRVVGEAIRQVGGGRPVRLDTLENLAAVLLPAIAAAAPLGRTLGGTLLRLSRDGTLALAREGARRNATTRADHSVHVLCNPGAHATTACSASLGKGDGDAYIGA